MNLLKITAWVTFSFIYKKHYFGAATEIPSYLSECYEIDWDVTEEYQQLPMTIPVLIDIIRTLENQPGIPNKIEDMTLILLTFFRFDGAKKNTDFSVNSFDLQQEKQMLINRMLREQNYNQLNSSLLLEEKCHLHFMLSNTFDDTVRLSENRTFFKPYGHPKGSEADLSECPIETGVVSTEFGPVTIGLVIARIAAGLRSKGQKEGKDLTLSHDRIEWAVSLAKQLATTPIFNMCSPVITVSGTFDDPYFPRYYYINNNKDWQLTEAALNAEIDGIILASNVDQWRKQFQSIKLSQLLEMYYSKRGVFNRTIFAGNRIQLLTEILHSF